MKYDRIIASIVLMLGGIASIIWQYTPGLTFFTCVGIVLLFAGLLDHIKRLKSTSEGSQ